MVTVTFAFAIEINQDPPGSSCLEYGPHLNVAYYLKHGTADENKEDKAQDDRIDWVTILSFFWLLACDFATLSYVLLELLGSQSRCSGRRHCIV